MNYIKFIFGFIFTLSLNAFAEEFPFDTSTGSKDEIEKGFSTKAGLQDTEKEKLNSDKLAIGGSLRNDLNVFKLEGSPNSDFIQNPTNLTLYLDSKLNDEVRGFFRGRLTYDSTVDPTTSTPSILGFIPSKSLSQLDEMKIQFQIMKTIFVSMGVQKIKWGSGHFWNPTDFLNRRPKDIFDSEDRRAGLDLLKLHLPWESMNFYAISDLTSANETKKIGTALRAEIPLPKALTSGELCLSSYSKSGIATKYGADVSMSLGIFDVNLEASKTKENKSSSAVAGISYDLQYSDEDLLNITYESYWNESGAKSVDDYAALLIANKFIPLQIAKSYHLLSLFLPKPGSLQHSDFLIMLIQNGIDKSNYARLGYTWTGIRDLTLTFFIGTRSGTTLSEMRFGGQSHDYALRTEIKF